MADSRSITRRLFMRHGAAASLAVSTTALAAVPVQATEYPRQKVNRLAGELSQAMDEWMADLGHDGVPDLWKAHVLPASTHEYPVWFEHLRNRYEPTPQERVELARRELIAATKAAYPDISDWQIADGSTDKTCADNRSFVGMFFVMGHTGARRG